MNVSLGRNKSINLSGPKQLPGMTPEDVENFYRKNTDLADVYTQWMSADDTRVDETIRRYIVVIFEEILKLSGFTDDLDEITAKTVRSPKSVASFISYGDDVATLMNSIDDLYHDCETFERRKRAKWEQNLELMNTYYKAFMEAWINEDAKPNFDLDIRQS